MQLFYSSEIDQHSTHFSFDKEESRHIVRVLRKKESDLIYLTNGKGHLFEGEITSAFERKCEVKIIKNTFFDPCDYQLHLAVAPTKMNDRYEWFLEKATEIGISEITPIICEHSERKEIKTERFEKILLSAMKQSLQYYLPKLNSPIRFSDFIGQEMSGQLFIAHCIESDKKELVKEVQPKGKITILIGPEGDFSEKEVETALAKGYLPVSLGNTRLRTETAAVYACVVVSTSKCSVPIAIGSVQ
ncbi:MAG: 16S rRNA (uracil(1498)-N(3))-methyltransferase [Flavobacteriaceae bacterium]